MNKTQKLSPKYWVVHDTEDSGVFIDTAHHCKMDSVEIFLNEYSYDILGVQSDEDVLEWWEEQTRYKCELIEIKLVETL